MIRFTALVAAGTPTAEAFAIYAAHVGPDDAATARALLTGTRPKRIATADTLLAWVATATQTPDFLIQSCLATTPNKLEVASLLLPLVRGAPPTLTETLAQLTPATYLSLALRLPPQARLILNRLATGAFRTRLPSATDPPQFPGTCLAILTMLDPSGPTAYFALPHGSALIPLTKVLLTLPQTAEILMWSRNHTTNRFGPLRELSPILIFEITHQGTTPNPRRKSGVNLVGATLIQWHPTLTPDRATPLEDLKRHPQRLGPPPE